MNTAHYVHWPKGLPHHLIVPSISVYENLQISAQRYPDKAAIIFYDSVLTYRQLHQEVLALAGYLQQVCGIQRGDRVLLDMQNSPQFVIGFYAILRADAMVVPVNPMLMTDELDYYIKDSGAKAALVSQDVFPRLAPLVGSTALRHAVVATYSDHLTCDTTLTVPEFVKAAADVPASPQITRRGKQRLQQLCLPPHIRQHRMIWPACLIPLAQQGIRKAAFIPIARSCSILSPARPGPALSCRITSRLRCCLSFMSPVCNPS
jgi:non-ribosomal peptide synthetase component F